MCNCIIHKADCVHHFIRMPLLQALIGLFELPEDESIPDDEHFIDVEETVGELMTLVDERDCLRTLCKITCNQNVATYFSQVIKRRTRS